ncbi:MAG: hypothetical protein ABRQ38_03255 [Candidatus Eremiobacterota bacterium]
MFGGYISQGVLQSNQQKTVQSLPNRAGNIAKTPKDSVQISSIDSNDMIFNVKKFGFMEGPDKLPVTGETVPNSLSTGITISHEEIQVNEFLKAGISCDRQEGLTPHFLCGYGEVPAAEGAILTARTIIEHDMAEKGKDKYDTLKPCPASSKIISAVHGFDGTLSDIVVKNKPILLEFI